MESDWQCGRAGGGGERGRRRLNDRGRGDDRGPKNEEHGQAGPPAEYGVAAVSVQRGGGPRVDLGDLLHPPGVTGRRHDGRDVPLHVPDGLGAVQGVDSGPRIEAGAGAVGFYPRVLIHRQDYVSPGAESYCEYTRREQSRAGAAAGAAALELTGLHAVSNRHRRIGRPGGPDPTAGAVNQITVPAGYYDVFSTFAFVKQ